MKTPYPTLKRMLDNATWAAEFYASLGLFSVALRYSLIANRILNTMIKL